MIKTFLFDLDGTLIDTPKIILETFKDIFNTYLPDVKLSKKEYEDFLGHTLFQTIGNYEKDENRRKLIIEAYHDLSNERINQTLDVYPKAKETLMYLKKKGIKIGVVTSKLRTKASMHLKQAGLLEYIDGIIGYEDVTKHKPDKEPIIKALELLNSKKEETIYIGDHENDIKSAKNAGIISCAVSYSIRLQELLFEQPDYIIDELENLKDLI
jgi:HAD superfamily hydrolase (TIGR01549 family)